MSVELLDKTRRINKLLHNSSEHKLVFDEVCVVLTGVLESNTVVISRTGKVLGVNRNDDFIDLSPRFTDEVGVRIDSVLNERILNVLSTKENVNLATLGFGEDVVKGAYGMIVPIYISGERLGTLFMYKKSGMYEISDIILSEYAATVLSLLILSSENEERLEETMKKQDVAQALNSLSSSELESAICVFDEINGGEGMLVASKIADGLGITRSIIVNALRKLESAGIIETRSQGMKGTYVKVINDLMYDELKKKKQ